MPAPTCWGTPGRESPLFIAGTWCSAWGRRHPQEPGQLPTGDWQPFREEEEEKAPDCQAAVQLLETAPVVVCITKHSSAGSGDTCLHPVAHGWKPRSQRSAGWRDPGVCLLRCRARHARAARGLEAQGWLVCLRQRWEGVKSALPAGSVPARFLCRCRAERGRRPCCPSPCRTRCAALRGDIGGSAQGHPAALPHGSPRHGEQREPREMDVLCGSGRWTG